jgi:hypothetical protein
MVICLEMPGAWSSASHVSMYTIEILVFSDVLKYCNREKYKFFSRIKGNVPQNSPFLVCS